MYAVRSELLRAVEWLQDSTVVERHYQAAMLIRVAVLDYERRKAAQELDVVQALVPKLEYGAEHPVTLVAVEGLACLVADNPKSRKSASEQSPPRVSAGHHVHEHQAAALQSVQEQLRQAGGHKHLVDLLKEVQNNPHCDLAHRLLMIFQIVSDSEPDRKILISCNIGPALMPFLGEGLDYEVAEHALSAVCNLGAGAAVVKAHLAEAGAIPALLDQLAPTADAGLAQLAALSLRNLSKHPLCKIQVINSGGVSILLDFLSEGLEVLKYPLRCEITYKCAKAPSATVPGLMAVDVDRGQLILAPEDPPGCCASNSGPSANPHMDGTAERYSMLMKALKLSHPRSDQLDLSFAVDGAGAVKLPESGSGKPPRELLKVAVDECDARELSELLTKLLNKLYTQQDFATNEPATLSLAAADPLATSATLIDVL